MQRHSHGKRQPILEIETHYKKDIQAQTQANTKTQETLRLRPGQGKNKDNGQDKKN